MNSAKKVGNVIRASFRRLKGKRTAKVPEQDGNTSSSAFQRDATEAAKPPQPLKEEPLKEDTGSGKSFWEQAAEKLEPKVRTALDEIREAPEKIQKEANKADDSTNIPPLPRTVSDEAQRRMEDMEHRQWALPIGVRGKVIEIRGLLNRILKFAKVVKEKGDALIRFDPTGYAKFAWVPFSLIVDLTTIELEQHYAALDAFSNLSFLVYQYAEVESIYHDRKDRDKEFEKRLVELYGKVLECEVALVDHFCRNGFQLLGVRLDVDELVDDKRRKEVLDILRWITDHDPSVSRKLAIENAKLDTDYSDTGTWLVKHETFREWSLSKPNEIQHGIQPLWLHGPVGCGKTSLTTRVIEDFLKKASASKHEDNYVTYFYCSKTQRLGSKTVDILRSIVRQLAWSPKDSQIEGIIKDAWESRQSHETDKLSVDECKKVMRQLAGRCQSITIIIDALDECNNPFELLKSLKELSFPPRKRKVPVKLFLSSRDEVRFDIKRTFPECLSINITSNSVALDLRRFIEGHVKNQLERYPELGTKEYSGLRQRLIEDLSERGKLAFRWTELQLALFFPLGKPFNPEAMEERLNDLKERVGVHDLNNTYKEIYEKNTGAYKQDLNRALKWVLACEGPVDILLLVDVIKSHHEGHSTSTSYINETYILNVASNLLVVDDDEVVQFAHISVKEYLQTASEFQGEFSDVEANIQIADSCLAYVLSSNSKFPQYSPYGLVRSESFPRYSIVRWPLHCARAGEGGRQKSPLQEHFRQLILGVPIGDAFQSWIQACENWHFFKPYFDVDGMDEAISTTPNAYFVACIWGFLEVINSALRQVPEMLEARNTNGKTGLHLAAYYGHVDVVKALLDKCADVEVRVPNRDIDLSDAELSAEDTNEKRALHLAAGRGHVEVVKVLLQERKDVSVNAEDRHGWTTLHLAAKYGYVEIVKVLLEKRGDVKVNANGVYFTRPMERLMFGGSRHGGQTALHLAASNGHVEVVTVLLEKRGDIDVNIQGEGGQTVLHLAAHGGHVEVVQALLKKRGDTGVNAENDGGKTALHLAARRGHVEVVKTLLEKRGDVAANVEGRHIRTALHLAAYQGHVEVVQTLLKECGDIDINVKGEDGQTALHLAACEGHVKVVQMLLEKRRDINVNVKGKDGQTALHLAVHGDHIEVLHALLEKRGDIDINVEDDNGQTALHLAACEGHVKVVQILLEKCADINVNAEDKGGRTALHLAVDATNYDYTEQGWPETAADVVEALLEKHKNVNVNAEDDNRQTALHIAAKRGFVTVVETLLKNGGNIDVNIEDKDGQTALHLAASQGHIAVVWTLLEKRRDIKVNVKEEDGRTALHLAAYGGHAEAVKALLENGRDIDVNMEDKDRQTALHLAAYGGHTEAVKALLENGGDIDVNMEDKDGQTVLHLAASQGRTTVVETLLEKRKDVNVNTEDKDGQTALHLAAHSGRVAVVRTLLEKRRDINVNAKDKGGRTALHLALRSMDNHYLYSYLQGRWHSRQFSMVQTLLEKRKDINVNAEDEDGQTPLHLAAKHGFFAVIKTLVEKRKDVKVNAKNTNGETALHLAAYGGHTEAVKALLEKRDAEDQHEWIEDWSENEGTEDENEGTEDENEGTEDGSESEGTEDESDGPTSHVKAVNVLLEKRGDIEVNTADKHMLTALHIAAASREVKVIEGLLERRADTNVNAEDEYGWTALHIAAFYGCVNVVQTLLKKRGDVSVNAKDKDGRTVLHWAASKGYVKVVKALLEKRTDTNVDVKDAEGCTALDRAAEGGHIKVVDVLQERDGRIALH